MTVNIVTTEGEVEVMANLKRKADSADRMFTALVEYVNEAIAIDTGITLDKKERVPEWL